MLLEATLSIHLICAGGGAHVSQETATAVRNYDYSNPITVTGRVRMGYNDEVALDINGDTGRIRVPDGIKPRIRSGGDDGWWQLRDIHVGEDEITASVHLNFMNHPSIRIDRRSGNISIQGRSGNFSGYCDPYDPAATPRRF